MSLENLIDKLLEYQGTSIIGRRIEDSLPPLCRPRALLAAAELRDDPYGDPSVVVSALRHMFLIFTPREAVARSCSLRPLVDLHSDISGEHRFTYYGAEIGEVADALLQEFGVPSPSMEPHPLVRSLAEAIREIEQIERIVMRSVDQDVTDAVSLQGGAITAWALVESVLKLSLAFFVLHFGTRLPSKISSRCRSALQKGSAGRIPALYREIEIIFGRGELNADKRRRNREMAEVLANTEVADLRRQRREELAAQKKQEEEQKQEYAKRLRARCRQDFGRETPFQGINTEHYRDWISLERNPFAHKPLEDIVTGTERTDRIIQSLNKAKQIIQDLRKTRVVPRIVVMLGECRDWHGNLIVWFTERSNLDSRLPRPERVEWMYPPPGGNFAPFQQVAIIAPRRDPRMKEPLIEPVIYPIEDIAAILSSGT